MLSPLNFFSLNSSSSSMAAKMARRALIFWSMLTGFAIFTAIAVSGAQKLPSRKAASGLDRDSHFRADFRRLQALKSSITRLDSNSIASPPSSFSPSPSPSPLPSPSVNNPRIYLVTAYGADPTGNSDSTQAFLQVMADATKGINGGELMQGITDLGGAQINLQGGNYLISQPLQLPATGVGNLMIHGGTIKASDNFPADGYLIDLSENPNNKNGDSSSSYNYEYITLKDLLLDSNYKGGGISVINSIRTSIDNCYITHFTSNGILVKSGHETYIRNSFLGQHITAGGDKAERSFSGTGINLQGNDNAVTDVVIFSGGIGIMVTGQANTFSGVHCYNKATGFGGTGIYLKLPGLTQTRIVNSYMDYTGIVAEDPVQLHVSSSFFLGDGNIVLKSINGVANGVSIVDNMFSGSNNGVEIVKLDQSNGPFKQVDQVFVDRNIARGMNTKATVAKVSMKGNGTSWTLDFNKILLFPDLIRHVQYSLSAIGNGFPVHALRNVSENRVVIETNEAVTANVFVTVDQGVAS